MRLLIGVGLLAAAVGCSPSANVVVGDGLQDDQHADEAAATERDGSDGAPGVEDLDDDVPVGDAGDPPGEPPLPPLPPLPPCGEPPEPPVDGPVSDEPAVAEAQRARAAIGLASDQAATRAAMHQPAADVGGAAVTEAEFTELMARNDLTPDAGSVREWAAEHAPDAYAGQWSDHLVGGQVKVALVGAEDHRGAFESHFGETGVRLVNAEHSLAELRALQDAIHPIWLRDWEQTESADHESSYGSEVSEARNRVEVTLPASAEEVVAEIAERHPEAPICVRYAAE